MKPVSDFFHPSYNGWENHDIEVPEPLRNAMPTLSFDDQLIIRQQVLPFYPDSCFLILDHPDWTPKNLFVYALVKGDEVFWLNGTSPVIHKFNGDGNLILNESNVLEYLHFFCFFVRGEEGPFYLLNSADAPYLPDCIRQDHDKGAGDQREIFLLRYQSPRYFGTSSEGSHRISALLYYSNAMFVADFEVQKSGMISMDDDTPILADLPSKIDAPIAPSVQPEPTTH